MGPSAGLYHVQKEKLLTLAGNGTPVTYLFVVYLTKL
jgi:hypothetical protein